MISLVIVVTATTSFLLRQYLPETPVEWALFLPMVLLIAYLLLRELYSGGSKLRRGSNEDLPQLADPGASPVNEHGGLVIHNPARDYPPVPGQFRVVSNGWVYYVQRYVRVWWKLWLGRGWVYEETGDGYCRNYATLKEAQDQIQSIIDSEIRSRGPWKPVTESRK